MTIRVAVPLFLLVSMQYSCAPESATRRSSGTTRAVTLAELPVTRGDRPDSPSCPRKSWAFDSSTACRKTPCFRIATSRSALGALGDIDGTDCGHLPRQSGRPSALYKNLGNWKFRTSLARAVSSSRVGTLLVRPLSTSMRWGSRSFRDSLGAPMPLLNDDMAISPKSPMRQAHLPP